MMCDKCNKTQATVYFKKNINGNVTEYHLCSDCAEAMDVFSSFSRHHSLVQTIHNNFFGASPFGFDLFANPFGFFAPLSASGNASAEERQDTCPYCGSTFEEYEKTGKFGCAMCYETFKEQFENAEKTKKSDDKDKISSLRTKLQEAIKQEHYEDAAKLRDEIKALESGT